METTIAVTELMNRQNTVNRKVEHVSVIYSHVTMVTAFRASIYAMATMIVLIIAMKTTGTSAVSIMVVVMVMQFYILLCLK